MTNFYCTAFAGEDQISMSYNSIEKAKQDVIDYMIEKARNNDKLFDELATYGYDDDGENEDAVYEYCAESDWSRDELGYGIIVITANDEDNCWEVYLKDNVDEYTTEG